MLEGHCFAAASDTFVFVDVLLDSLGPQLRVLHLTESASIGSCVLLDAVAAALVSRLRSTGEACLPLLRELVLSAQGPGIAKSVREFAACIKCAAPELQLLRIHLPEVEGISGLSHRLVQFFPRSWTQFSIYITPGAYSSEAMRDFI